MPKFIVDECTGIAVAHFLQEQGFDTVSVSEESPQTSDLDILHRAVAEQRIVVTNDKDFGEMIFRDNQPHQGVLLLRLADDRVTTKIRVLVMRSCCCWAVVTRVRKTGISLYTDPVKLWATWFSLSLMRARDDLAPHVFMMEGVLHKHKPMRYNCPSVARLAIAYRLTVTTARRACDKRFYILPMSSLLQLTLLGSPEVRHHGQLVSGFRSSKAQALLYYLAVTGRPHTRATLSGLLWGEQPEAAARTSLSQCLSNLHKLLGDAVLVERQTANFNCDYPYQLDTECFAAGVGQPPSAATIHSLQTALALYKGDFLEGFYVRAAPDFEQWVLTQRVHYREAMITGLHRLATYAEQQSDLPQAIVHTRRLLALEPWREEAHRQLMNLLARSGQRAAALAQFETCRRILEEELATEPDPETLALVETIRAGEFDKVTGWQGDKVKGAQVHLVTLSLPHPVTPPLPTPPIPLIGRERALAELGALIRNPQCKLITITGPGGMGKTRLALAAAADQSAGFAHGALFVPLAGVAAAHFLPQAILAALGVPLRGDLSPQQQVRASFYDQECLLLLDNYEHLLPDVALLLDLLNYAPKTTLLVTARERLALQAEHLYELTGLDYPPSQPTPRSAKVSPDATRYAAVQLFLQRVQQTQPRFAPSAEELAAIIRICRISEGLPLALELAAAGGREQSIVTLAAALEAGEARLASRLRDLPLRHRTIEAVFDYSWHMLAVTELTRKLASSGIHTIWANFGNRLCLPSLPWIFNRKLSIMQVPQTWRCSCARLPNNKASRLKLS